MSTSNPFDPDQTPNELSDDSDLPELIDRVTKERQMSRRSLLKNAGKVLLAAPAYEIAALGLVGCGGYNRAFRARDGEFWRISPVGDFDGRAWAGLQIGQTTVEQLTVFQFNGEVQYQPRLGRIELVPATPPDQPGLPHRLVLIFRHPEDGRMILRRESVLFRIELGFPNTNQPEPLIRVMQNAFGRGEVLHVGTRGEANQIYLLFREQRVFCHVVSHDESQLWTVFYQPGYLQQLAEDQPLCSVQCTFCTSSCTGCTEQCTSPCTAACTGCTEPCTAGCTANCTSCTECTVGCTDSCTSGCTAGCTSCTGSCTSGCTSCTSCTSSTSCSGSTSCSYCTSCTSCTSGCTIGCTAGCTSCTGMCTSGCTSCTSGCTQCTGCTICTSGCTRCTGCTDRCTSCTACTSCTEGCTLRTGRFDG